jgi:ribonuclease BN (tRNA processing enzyme)
MLVRTPGGELSAKLEAVVVSHAHLDHGRDLATLADNRCQMRCPPLVVAGTTYKCYTESGAKSYFNVVGAVAADPPDTGPRKSAAAAPSPAGFPKVDPATQKSRDDVRRKVLGDELATEEKLLTEARVAYADGAPPALPEERSNVEKYRERIARLRQSVGVHEKNVEALKKELASGR